MNKYKEASSGNPMSTKTPSTDSQSTEQAVLAETQPSFGWTQYAEQTNGRFAMIGFVSLLVLELFAKQDFFTWIGLR